MTVRMAFISSWVAASFITTPRAPNCKACTISMRSTAAVSTMILVCEPLPSAESSRSTSIPGMPGMARSKRRMSGLSSRVWVTVSAPSAASPATSNSGSASSKRRSPSRKMVWSSAMRIRTDGSFLSIGFVSFLGNSNLQPRSMSGSRLDEHLASHSAYSFLDHCRPAPQAVEIIQGKPAGKRKAVTIVSNHQLPHTVLRTKAHDRRAGAAVLADIHQALLYNAGQFTTSGCGQRNFLQLGNKARGNSGVSGETLHQLGYKVDELMRPNINGAHGLH